MIGIRFSILHHSCAWPRTPQGPFHFKMLTDPFVSHCLMAKPSVFFWGGQHAPVGDIRRTSSVRLSNYQFG